MTHASPIADGTYGSWPSGDLRSDWRPPQEITTTRRVQLITKVVLWAAPRAGKTWLLGCGSLFALALILFVLPAGLEGPVLVPISPGHGLSLVDVVALVPLLAGTGLLAGGLWQRRQRLGAALTRKAWCAWAGAFVAGLGLGLLVASVFVLFWWWAIGAALLTPMLLAAALVAAGSDGARRDLDPPAPRWP